MHVIENPTADFERQFVVAINNRRKLKGNKPKFLITSNQVSSSNEDHQSKQVILTVKSLQTLVLSCVDKSPRAYSASWCKILRVQKLQQILVVVLNGVSNNSYIERKETEQFQGWRDVFTSDNVCHEFVFQTQAKIPFVEQFSKIAAKSRSGNPSQDRSMITSKAEQLSSKRQPSEENDGQPSKKFRKTVEDQFSRVQLVLNLKQLLLGNYPCPVHNPFRHFQELKSSYQPVTSASRIFALDVETFSDMINNRQVPYWVSIVDEQLNCVYQTLIQPNDELHAENYRQRRSQVIETVPDITERSLEQVHGDLQRLFDDDLILAGHSIENDLKYLQMYYPYIIDTSIIFNISGTRLEKSSLQKLYAIFFGRLIQKKRLEHDPTEDARATMELIQLKLSHSIEFGDWFLGGVDQLKVLGNFDSLQLNENIEQCQTFLAQTKFGLQEDFFKKIRQQNKAVIIDREAKTERISLPTIEVDSNRRALKTCIEQLATQEFVWLQLYVPSLDNHNDDDDDEDGDGKSCQDSSLMKISKYLGKLYQSLREDSILIGIMSDQADMARCFVRIKDDARLSPLIIDGKEFPHDLKLVKNQ